MDTTKIKLGRNDSCHCGSNKKYKACCLSADDEKSNVLSFDPTVVREKGSSAISKFIENNDFDSFDDLRDAIVGKSFDELEGQFLKGMAEYDKRTHEAQGLVYDAWEASTTKKQISLAHKALTLDPNCCDAYLILADVKAKTVSEKLSYYRLALTAGKNQFDDEFFEENEGHFWLINETRGFMRAKLALAELLWALGEKQEALFHYSDLIRLNPNDNQGVRDLLIRALLDLEDLSLAQKIFKKYDDDCSLSWTFGRALFYYMKTGPQSKRAVSLLKKGHKANPHVVDYLLEKKEFPDISPSHYSFGSEEEAVIYADDNFELWEKDPARLKWLRESLKL